MHRIDHGTMFYKAVKQGLIDPKKSVQVGIRTYNSDTLGVNIIDAEVFEIGPGKTAEKIKSILGDTPTYLTFDIDCLDPAYAPGTGTPVWGGLSYPGFNYFTGSCWYQYGRWRCGRSCSSI